MQMTGEHGLEWASGNGVNMDGRREDRFGGNFSIPEFKPWGSQGVVATVSIIFTVWVVLANAFLIAVIITSGHLRRQRLTIYVVQIALADLAIGVFYCPLSADLYNKQVWTHGCESVFVWNSFLYITTFVSVHALGLINLNRLFGNCCRLRIGPKLKLTIAVTLTLLLWGYLVMFVTSLFNMRAEESVTVFPNIICHANLSDQGVIVASLLAFFAPAIVTVILLVVVVVREKFTRPTHQELNRTENKVFSLRVLAAANVTTLSLSLPWFITSISLSLGSCGSLDCIHWILPLTTVVEWLLLAKSGIQPLVWLVNPDYKTAMLPVVRFIRRQPGMDTTELVEAEENSQDSDHQPDAPDNCVA